MSTYADRPRRPGYGANTAHRVERLGGRTRVITQSDRHYATPLATYPGSNRYDQPPIADPYGYHSLPPRHPPPPIGLYAPYGADGAFNPPPPASFYPPPPPFNPSRPAAFYPPPPPFYSSRPAAFDAPPSPPPPPGRRRYASSDDSSDDGARYRRRVPTRSRSRRQEREHQRQSRSNLGLDVDDFWPDDSFEIDLALCNDHIYFRNQIPNSGAEISIQDIKGIKSDVYQKSEYRVIRSNYLGDVYAQGQFTAKLTTEQEVLPNSQSREEPLFRWIHLQSQYPSLSSLTQEIQKLAFCSDEEKDDMISILRNARDSRERPILASDGVRGMYLEPLLFEGNIADSRTDKKSRNVRLICVPYFSLAAYTPNNIPLQSPVHPARTLLQYLDPSTPRKRDLSQIVCKLNSAHDGLKGHCFHVPHIWCLILNESLLITCSQHSRNEIQSGVIEEHQTSLLESTSTPHFVVSNEENRVWILPMDICRHFFVFKSHFLDLGIDFDQEFEVRFQGSVKNQKNWANFIDEIQTNLVHLTLHRKDSVVIKIRRTNDNDDSTVSSIVDGASSSTDDIARNDRNPPPIPNRHSVSTEAEDQSSGLEMRRFLENLSRSNPASLRSSHEHTSPVTNKTNTVEESAGPPEEPRNHIDEPTSPPEELTHGGELVVVGRIPKSPSPEEKKAFLDFFNTFSSLATLETIKVDIVSNEVNITNRTRMIKKSKYEFNYCMWITGSPPTLSPAQSTQVAANTSSNVHARARTADVDRSREYFEIESTKLAKLLQSMELFLRSDEPKQMAAYDKCPSDSIHGLDLASTWLPPGKLSNAGKLVLLGTKLHRFYLPLNIESRLGSKFWGALLFIARDNWKLARIIPPKVFKRLEQIALIMEEISQTLASERSSLLWEIALPKEFSKAWIHILQFIIFSATAEPFKDYQFKLASAQDLLLAGEKKLGLNAFRMSLPETEAALPSGIAALVISRVLRDVNTGSRDIYEVYHDYFTELDRDVIENPYDRKHQRKANQMLQEIAIIKTVLELQESCLNDLHSSIKRKDETVKSPYGRIVYSIKERPFYISNETRNFIRARLDSFSVLTNLTSGLAEFNLTRIESNKDRQEAAIMVFTIVTVIFLPLSFISSFLGMNTNDIRNMEFNQWIFWACGIPVTILVLGLTFWLALKTEPTGQSWNRFLKSVSIKMENPPRLPAPAPYPLQVDQTYGQFSSYPPPPPMYSHRRRPVSRNIPGQTYADMMDERIY